MCAVPRFEPFPALRYAADVDLDDVIAPPYDVLSDADVDALAARDPTQHRPHRRAPRRTAATATTQAGRPLRAWIADGVLVTRRRPDVHAVPDAVHRRAGTARDTVGVLGGLEVVDEGAGGVLPHERTTPKARPTDST